VALVHLGALQKNLPLVRLMIVHIFFHEMKIVVYFFVYGKFKTTLLFLANKREGGHTMQQCTYNLIRQFRLYDCY
jgi:hypothetical protein